MVTLLRIVAVLSYTYPRVWSERKRDLLRARVITYGDVSAIVSDGVFTLYRLYFALSLSINISPCPTIKYAIKETGIPDGWSVFRFIRAEGSNNPGRGYSR